MLIWLAIGATAFFSTSVMAAVLVTAALREIALRTSNVLDEEAWATAPPARASRAFDNVTRLTAVPKPSRASN
jgi:hypothetical protein